MKDFNSSYSVAVAIETPIGTPLVLDPHKPAPRFWKFPGGRNNKGEQPQETATREILEETGISLKPEDLILVHEEDRLSHGETIKFFLYYARTSEDIRPLTEGIDGEQIMFLEPEKVYTLADLFINHKILLDKIPFSTKQKTA